MTSTNQRILNEVIVICGKVDGLLRGSETLLATLKAHSTEMAQRDTTKRQDLLSTLAAENLAPNRVSTRDLLCLRLTSKYLLIISF